MRRKPELQNGRAKENREKRAKTSFTKKGSFEHTELQKATSCEDPDIFGINTGSRKTLEEV